MSPLSSIISYIPSITFLPPSLPHLHLFFPSFLLSFFPSSILPYFPSGQRRVLPTSSSSSSSSNGNKPSSSASSSSSSSTVLGGSSSAPVLGLGLEGGGGPADVDSPSAHAQAVRRTSALLIGKIHHVCISCHYLISSLLIGTIHPVDTFCY